MNNSYFCLHVVPEEFNPLWVHALHQHLLHVELKMASASTATSNMLSLLREWDKGSKTVRAQILLEFVLNNQNKTGPEIEARFAQGASLFLARLTAWLRLTYPLKKCNPSQSEFLLNLVCQVLFDSAFLKNITLTVSILSHNGNGKLSSDLCREERFIKRKYFFWQQDFWSLLFSIIW